MPGIVSTAVSVLKWPAGLAVALLTPAAARGVWDLLGEAWRADLWWSPFGLGFAGTVVCWAALHRLRFVRFWSTMEHELTHALFAWLTFVPVLELRSTDGSPEARTDDSLGHVRLGGSNWLILTSPYFFPTAAVALLVAVALLAAEPTVLARVLLGAATAYSLCSTWQETHPGQSDFRHAGRIFCVLLLPGANLLCYGALLANELGGLGRALAHLTGTVATTIRWVTG
jgi:hypothetical protein